MEKTEPKIVVTKAFSADVRAVAGERAILATISTSIADREGEVLVPQGCNSKEYEDNPIVFVGHWYDTTSIFGKVVAIRRTDDAIEAKLIPAARPDTYPAEQEWMPDTLYSLYEQNVLRGFSVGLDRIESRAATTRDMTKYGEGCSRVTSKWKLIELSVAPIPMNQEALAFAVTKGLVSAETARKLYSDETKSEEKPVEVSLQLGKCEKCGAMCDEHNTTKDEAGRLIHEGCGGMVGVDEDEEDDEKKPVPARQVRAYVSLPPEITEQVSSRTIYRNLTFEKPKDDGAIVHKLIVAEYQKSRGAVRL